MHFLFFFVLCFVLMFLLMAGYVALSNSEEVSMEEESPYECGFESLSVTRATFSHRFFLISILFLIFDVEIVLMLPIPFLVASVVGVSEFLLFTSVLLAGLMYEYNYGSLDWL